jgi:hypothetical protein
VLTIVSSDDDNEISYIKLAIYVICRISCVIIFIIMEITQLISIIMEIIRNVERFLR